MKRFTVVLNEQGQFSSTCVGDFNFLPELGRHAWRGLIAETAEELAEQVNGAIKSVIDFGDPFKTIEVIAVGKLEIGKAKGENGDSREIILEANRQLQEVIEQVAPGPKKLRVAA